MSCDFATPVRLFLAFSSMTFAFSAADAEIPLEGPANARPEREQLEAYRFTDRPHYYGGCGYPDMGSPVAASSHDDVISPFFYSDYDYNVYDYGSDCQQRTPAGELQCGSDASQDFAFTDSEAPFIADEVFIGSGVAPGPALVGSAVAPAVAPAPAVSPVVGRSLGSWETDLRTGYDSAFDEAMGFEVIPQPVKTVAEPPIWSQAVGGAAALVATFDAGRAIEQTLGDSQIAEVARRTANGHYWQRAVVPTAPQAELTRLDARQYFVLRTADALEGVGSLISGAASQLRSWAKGSDESRWVSAPDPLGSTL